MMTSVASPSSDPGMRLRIGNALARYSEAFHGLAGPGHHVVSPLGAWILLALVAPAADAENRERLEAILGAPVEEAAAFARSLIDDPHPVVGCAVGAWDRAPSSAPEFEAWRAALPERVATGPIPTQAQIDRWTDENTFGLIREFPYEITPDTFFLLASALATRVSWRQPYRLVDATELGTASAWAGSVKRVLAGRGPTSELIVETSRAGRVAVHTAPAAHGLRVTSVIAESSVPQRDVIAAAHEIATKAALTPGDLDGISLFDLALGDHQLWSLTEAVVDVRSSQGREAYRVRLPAWSAEAELNLLDEPELGFGDAARAIATAMGVTNYRVEAKQKAVARYSRTGFEAAAVTVLAMATSARAGGRVTGRTATLRFGHPYAVVAVAVDEHRASGDTTRGPWHGIPVFSAWVAEPEEPEDEARGEEGNRETRS